MKRFLLLVGALLLLASCTSEFDQLFNTTRQGARGPKVVFQATTEGPASPDTKVYADESMKVLWNADDRISIFNKFTLNTQWAFTGDDGDTAGEFEEIPSSTFTTGNPLSYIYAAYPYSKSTKISNDGVLTMVLPAEQPWKEHSFGIGANTMLAVTDGYFLGFKNVGGYISCRFYGDNVSVIRITIKGNNGEKIAGKARITMEPGGVPSVTMDNAATDEISVVCDPAVKLGATAEEYTEFWFVIPPVYFSLGFTITVTDDKGGVFERTTSKAITVNRNKLDWMNPLEVVPNYDNVTVPFEDADFKAYCVENFDGDKDGEISVAEAELVEAIDVCTDEIESLGGIEYFTNLKSLVCAGSLIGTKSTTGAYAGQLESIDIGGNILLEELDCHGNQLEEIDVSNNVNLETLICTDNPLETINLSPGQVIATLEAPEDTGIVYDWDDVIGPMSFPDEFFREYVFTNFDTDENGILSEAECKAVTRIDLAAFKDLSLKGISAFQNLEELACEVEFHAAGSELALEISQNTKLKQLRVRYFTMSNLDLSNNTELELISLYQTQITSHTLDISNCPSLTGLGFEFAGVSSLDVSNNPKLRSLDCSYNSITSLDLSHNPLLTSLCCEANFGLTTLVFGEPSSLKDLMCGGTKLANTLDLSLFPNLETLQCQDNVSTSNGTIAWTELDVSANPKLTSLKCNGNQLTTLDVSNNLALTTLDCYSNPMSTLYLASGQEITNLWKNDSTEIVYKGAIPASFPDENFRAYVFENFDTNQDHFLSQEECNAVTVIDVDDKSIASLEGIACFGNLATLKCMGNELTTLDLSHNTALVALNCVLNQLTSLDVTNNPLLSTLSCWSNQLTSLDVSHNTALTYLGCHFNQLASLDVSYNTNLIELNCSNNVLTSLDVSNHTALKAIHCEENMLAGLDVSGCTATEELECWSNRLISLNVSSCTALSSLDCSNNALSTLNVDSNTALRKLSVGNLRGGNQLTSLNLSNNTLLSELNCPFNQLSELDLSNNNLSSLWCERNNLTSLDVSHNAALTSLSCSSNPSLTEIWLKRGQTIQNFDYDTSVATIKYKD